MKKIFCLFFVFVLLVSACSTQPTSGGIELGEATVKDTIVFALSAELPNLGNHATNDQNAQLVWYNLHDFLVYDNFDGTYTPGLAESWEFSEDGLELKLHLRKGVLFHNGEPFTADDVEFTVERARANSFTSSFFKPIIGTEVVDDHTIIIKFEKFFPSAIALFASALNGQILNRHAVEDSENRGVDPGLEPIGCGPYKIVEYKPGNRYIFEAFQNYWQGEAPIKNLHFRMITDASTTIVGLQTGEIDAACHMSYTNKNELLSTGNVSWYEDLLAGSTSLFFNNSEGVFANNKALRLAIAHAIDRESIILGAFNGGAKEAVSQISPATIGYPPDGYIQNYPYDLEKAKAYMVEAGYPDGLDLEIKTFEAPNYSTVAEILQGQLSKIGVNIAVNKMEKSAWITDVDKNKIYETTVWTLSRAFNAPDYVYAHWHSTGSGNRLRLNDSRIDALMDDTLVNMDDEARLKDYYDVQKILVEEAYYVPFCTQYTALAANSALKGVKPSGCFYYKVFDYSW